MPQHKFRRAAYSTMPRLVPARMVLNDQNPGDWLPFPTPGSDLTGPEWSEMVIRPLVANAFSLSMTTAMCTKQRTGTPLYPRSAD